MKNNNKQEILDFIKRRFAADCNWTTGNCYYFAMILSNRFPDGTIYYDVVNGHFVFRYGESYYDWSGEVFPDGYLVEWDHFEEYDPLQKDIIMRDCVL